MKKLFFLTIALVVSVVFTSQAQESTFGKGNKVINASIGLGSVLYSGLGYSTQVPPISASLELGVKDNFLTDKLSLGIGGYIGYSKNKWAYSSYNWGYTYSNLIIGGRLAAHYPFLEKFDTYAGIMIGFDIVSSKEYGINSGFTNNSSGSGLVWSSYIGGRYYFTPKFAGLCEIGYGIAWLNLGLAFKL